MTIQVYTRPGCLLCSQVIDLLQAENLPFEVRQITDRNEQQRLALGFGAQGFPFVVVDGVYLGGYAHVLLLAGDGRLRRLGAPAREIDAPSDSSSWSAKMTALRGVLPKR